MNENIDLTKILDGCPVGTEFYHAAYGRVAKFVRIVLDSDCPIRCSLQNCRPRYADIAVTKKGAINALYEGECLLFPSKEQRDWSKFVRFWDKPKTERFDPKTFEPFDKVLSRYGTESNWTCTFFSHIIDTVNPHVDCNGIAFHICIPYNEETKHLIGTKEDCPEFYKWWEE